jgi:hypothetical protein
LGFSLHFCSLGFALISAPFNFEPEQLSDLDFQKIGHLSIKWSGLEHITGNCLKAMLRLSDAEAKIVVFSLPQEQRLNRMSEIADLGKISAFAQFYLKEFRAAFKGIQYVRNSVIHAIIAGDDPDSASFYLHSKGRSLPKTQVFSIEELTNYAAHVVFALRFSVGFLDGSSLPYTLPNRPEIPEFLRSLIQWPKEPETEGLRDLPQSSQEIPPARQPRARYKPKRPT